MVEKQQQVVEKLIDDPAVENIASFVGIDGSNATLNTGRLQITLKPSINVIHALMKLFLVYKHESHLLQVLHSIYNPHKT